MLIGFIIAFLVSMTGCGWLYRFTYNNKSESTGFYFVLLGMLNGFIIGSGMTYFYLDITNRTHPLGLWFVLLVGSGVMVIGGLANVFVYGRLMKKLRTA